MIYKFFFKRLLDILISFISLPFFLILYIPIAIIIKLEDGGPILYTAQRLGKNMVPFMMFKFRSMKVNAPDIRLSDGSTFSSKTDSRVTKIGKVLRETSLDEIPQILNVLIGDMSIIGPRPDMISDEEYPEEYRSFLSIKPGITGFNQAYFRNETNRLEKMKNDKYYVDNISFTMDVKVFFKTIAVVLQRKNMYRE
jgi:undecaprenyl phosphate N,N'-diacetylbacillosamine 1-phosphate transferase